MTTPDQPPTQQTRKRRVLPIALVIGLVAAAGGAALVLRNRSSETNIAVSGSGPGKPTEAGKPDTKPIGADDGAAEPLIIEITSGGGHKMWGAAFRQPLTRLENGVLYTEGAMNEIWPPQALHPVITRTLSPDEVATLRTKLAEAGLLSNGVDVGRANITDMATTAIKVTDAKGTYTNEIYAINYMIDFGSDDDPTLSGLTEQQLANRKKINELVALLSPGPDRQRAYAGDSVAFIARRIDQEEVAAQDPTPTTIAWPLPELLTAETENGVGCTLVTGADGKTLLDTLMTAKENSVFTAPDGSTWSVAARIVLPGETPCPTS